MNTMPMSESRIDERNFLLDALIRAWGMKPVSNMIMRKWKANYLVCNDAFKAATYEDSRPRTAYGELRQIVFLALSKNKASCIISEHTEMLPRSASKCHGSN